MVRFIRERSLMESVVIEVIAELENVFNEKVEKFILIQKKTVLWFRTAGKGELSWKGAERLVTKTRNHTRDHNCVLTRVERWGRTSKPWIA